MMIPYIGQNQDLPLCLKDTNIDSKMRSVMGSLYEKRDASALWSILVSVQLSQALAVNVRDWRVNRFVHRAKADEVLSVMSDYSSALRDTLRFLPELIYDLTVNNIDYFEKKYVEIFNLKKEILDNMKELIRIRECASILIVKLGFRVEYEKFGEGEFPSQIRSRGLGRGSVFRIRASYMSGYEIRRMAEKVSEQIKRSVPEYTPPRGLGIGISVLIGLVFLIIYAIVSHNQEVRSDKMQRDAERTNESIRQAMKRQEEAAEAQLRLNDAYTRLQNLADEWETVKETARVMGWVLGGIVILAIIGSIGSR